MQVFSGYGLFAVIAIALASPAGAADAARATPSPTRAEPAPRVAAPARASTPRPAPSASAVPAADRAAPSSQVPAVVAGSRSMDAATLARAGRQIEATPATTIYEARLSDGTLELSDRPPSTAASAVERHSYVLPQDSAARQRAESERDYWRRQAEGFERRQRDRDRELERERAVRTPRTIIVQADLGRRAAYHGYGWVPPDVNGGFVTLPGVPVGAVQPGYSSSPGAVQGRSQSGFIGSGFPSRW
jgi:hypothetical protein